jgi:nucleoside-diphosphate-sugar epimerase
VSRILVLGAGSIGRLTATRLVAAGHEVDLTSRSGSTSVDGARTVGLDVTDVDATRAAVAGTDAVVNAMNPAKYTTWDRDWPPMARSVQAALEAAGGRLVLIGNLYAYGRVEAPMSERTSLRPHGHKGELRRTMWEDLEAADRAGRLRAVELRASDSYGPGVANGTSYLNDYVVKPAATKGTVRLVLGSPDAPHSWTHLDDIAALAAAVAVREDDDVWGRPWMVPSESATLREVAERVASLRGRPQPRVVELAGVARAALRVLPFMRELDETRHQFEAPFVVDDTEARARFGLQPVPLDVGLKATVEDLLG